ncbi:MAG TPA: M14 metallopeptidase family protein [Acidobacteriota bacterium]|nr:M14 metallopeptidase family protein [Acidobacteriota bacterium]
MRRVGQTPVLLMILLASSMAFGQDIPSPEKYFGHQIGAERKLVRWDRMVEYLQLIARSSDRVRFRELGKTTNNNPFVMVVISSRENLKNIERYRSINKKLFDPRTIATDDEARRLSEEGKIFVLVTCSIHATEIGSNQMSVEAVYRLATETSPQIETILNNVVFLFVPSLNPDGQILVTDWYNKTLGTPNEDAPLPWLYHPYVGHDNNRDAFMFTQKETRLIGKVLYQDWLPSVWLDEHQMGSGGPRIFVMPALDPINPNVDPVIYRYTGLLGFSQAAALERAGKEGIIYGDMYTYWWEGAMAWAGWWHNMYGLLTEVASARIATTIEQQKVDPDNPPRPGRTLEERTRSSSQEDIRKPLPPPSDVQSRSNYPRPWLGGRWSLRDIVDYELIATFALLETSANMRSQLLEGLYTAGKRQIELGKKGDPFAIVVPKDQADRPTVIRLLQTLAYGGIEVHQALKPFTADDRKYSAGTYVILLSQPFRAYAKDMLEPQVYPKISPASGVPPRPPYDVAGWSLGMQMGVDTIFAKKPFEADLRKLDSIEIPPGEVAGHGSAYVLSHESNNSLVAVNRLIKAGFEVSWLLEGVTINGKKYAPGAIVVRGGKDLPAMIKDLASSLGVDAAAAEVPALEPFIRIRAPRTALYQPWGGNIDEGWTRWLLEQNEFPYVTLHPQDVRNGSLRGFDAIILPDMNPRQIINGLTGNSVPDEYKGGIEDSGLKALHAFVEEGGSIIALGQSSLLLMDKFAAPYRDSLHEIKREDFFCPGSIVRVLVDNTHPIAFGMKEEAGADFTNSMALEAVPSFSTMKSSIVVRYPSSDILMSGWLQGESYLYNKVGVAEVTLGKGRMILIPLRVQQRAQPFGTFKLLFNSILTSAATP